VRGAVISAVNLIHGLGVSAGLEIEHVEGVTGFLDTNYQGKVDHALARLERDDFVLLHVEAPDEAGHTGELDTKVRAIEDFDRRVIGPLRAGLQELPAYRLMVLPDHATPLEIRTHSRDPVPFSVFPAIDHPDAMQSFSEREAEKGSYQLSDGTRLLSLLLTGRA
jgi:2,3-bisphosphoglycerate-independent phosphoglycerate mutase